MTNPIKIIKADELKEKPNQEEIWDSIANPWKDYRVRIIPGVAEFLRDKKGKIVDLGCGSGRNMLTNPDIEYYCVDFSSVQLKHAEEKAKKEKINARFFKSKVDKLTFPDEMFDDGLFIATLHCLESEEERKNSLLEFYRVLKKNAEALISVWNSEDKRFDKVGNKGDIYMSWKEDGVNYMRYYYLFRKEEFMKLIKDSGFEILEFYSPKEKDRFSRKNWIARMRK